MKATMTNELSTEIMERGIRYTIVGDYFPTCMLADRPPNGKWAFAGKASARVR